jgi:hypothetical protein
MMPAESTEKIVPDVTLKSCPFCGNAAELTVWVEHQKRYMAHCSNDGCDVAPFVTGADKHQVIAIWNRRAEDIAKNNRLNSSAADLLAALKSILAVPEARKALANWGPGELILAHSAVIKAGGEVA